MTMTDKSVKDWRTNYLGDVPTIPPPDMSERALASYLLWAPCPQCLRPRYMARNELRVRNHKIPTCRPCMLRNRHKGTKS